MFVLIFGDSELRFHEQAIQFIKQIKNNSTRAEDEATNSAVATTFYNLNPEAPEQDSIRRIS